MGRLTKRINAEISKGLTYEAIIYKDIEHHETDFNYEALDKLAHYEDLEEQGRLIELPCAVGDTVWMVIDNRDFKRRMKDYCPSAEELPELNIVEHNFSLLLLSSIGKTVFLTKEEAEAKLRELERE